MLGPSVGHAVTVGHERDHQGRAEEHFLMPAGPFAILPLKGNRSSLVWTESREAARIVDLPADEFRAEFRKAVRSTSRRDQGAGQAAQVFPLGYFCCAFLHRRAPALVGDAAHVTIQSRPNMAWKDAAALASDR